MAHHLWDIERAQRYCEKALDLHRTTGDQHGYAFNLSYLGLVYLHKHEFAQARRVIAESLAIYDATGPDFGVANGLFHLADMAFIEGDYAQAEAHMLKSLEISEQFGNFMGSARRKIRLAQIALARGDVQRAQERLVQGIRGNLCSGDRWSGAMIMVTAADLAWAQGRKTYAARCLGKVQACIEMFGTHLWPVDRLIFDQRLRLLQDRLGQEAFGAACQEGHQQAKTMSRMDEALTDILENIQDGPPQAAGPLSRKAAKEAAGGLSAREREVAGLIAQGLNNAQIAAKLFLGIRTVETHVTHILTKLSYTSRTQIAVWAAGKDLAQVE
jgi:non-specific serine/threonine protein kinase